MAVQDTPNLNNPTVGTQAPNPASSPWTPENVISLFSGVLVIAIGSLAFTLSFNAIRELAESYGTPKHLSWIVPVIVDTAVIAFSVSVLRASLMGETGAKWVGRFLIVFYTGLSVAFNVGHSTGELWAIVIAVIVPITVLTGFETFVHQIESWVNRTGVIRTIADLQQQVTELTLNKARLDEKITEQHLAIEELNERIGELTLHKRILILNEAQRLLLEYVRLNPVASQIEMAKHIGKSKSTVSGYIRELIQTGLMVKGESGYEIVESGVGN